MKLLYFFLEHNLTPLQNILRTVGHSAFLPQDVEIGLSIDTEDEEIVKRIEEQKKDLGVSRIIITEDKKFIKSIGSAEVRVLVLIDQKNNFALSRIDLKKLAEAIIIKAEWMNKIKGQNIQYIDCSKL
ncbi:MAG TPA: hypothetical protein VFE88_02010 [Candidatus Nanoarchaeia archaeon]|nr:hypothetical protein [Candidatus Nanoarchaeia archaeon]